VSTVAPGVPLGACAHPLRRSRNSEVAAIVLELMNVRRFIAILPRTAFGCAITARSRLAATPGQRTKDPEARIPNPDRGLIYQSSDFPRARRDGDALARIEPPRPRWTPGANIEIRRSSVRRRRPAGRTR